MKLYFAHLRHSDWLSQNFPPIKVLKMRVAHFTHKIAWFPTFQSLPHPLPNLVFFAQKSCLKSETSQEVTESGSLSPASKPLYLPTMEPLQTSILYRIFQHYITLHSDWLKRFEQPIECLKIAQRKMMLKMFLIRSDRGSNESEEELYYYFPSKIGDIEESKISKFA